MGRLIKEWLRFFIAFISLANITDGKNEKYLRLGTSPQERSELPQQCRTNSSLWRQETLNRPYNNMSVVNDRVKRWALNFFSQQAYLLVLIESSSKSHDRIISDSIADLGEDISL